MAMKVMILMEVLGQILFMAMAINDLPFWWFWEIDTLNGGGWQ